MLSAPWSAVAVPLCGALLLAVGGPRFVRAGRWVAVLGPLWVALVGAAHLTAASGESVAGSVAWLRAGGAVLTVGYSLDALAAIMLVVVGAVAAMVMVFSVGYMGEVSGLARYFAVLSAFTAAMSGLVIADGLLTLFVAWELVGVCSYLLIGFWFTKPAAADAAMKAFLVTRLGDVGILVAMGLVWWRVGDLRYSAVLGAADTLGPALGAVCIALLVGAAGKSAQFPLHIWLPDAMEGPTPVSALIHAATMVAAGVFLLARFWPLFESSPAAMTGALWVGVLTATGAAIAAVSQRDIKKVLAYSTISQLGYMFAALGVGAWVAAVFHLVTHAAFKALLFLGSGSIIHATGTQDLHGMGGLRRAMPATAATWVVGAAALAGVPGLSGFFSKDEILHEVLLHAPLAGAMLTAAAFLTAFYVSRMTLLAFAGEPRSGVRAHEGPPSMTIPLVFLAIPSLLAGVSGHWIALQLGEKAKGVDPGTAVLSTLVVAAGAVAGWVVYRRGPAGDATLRGVTKGLWGASESAFGFDRAIRERVARPVAAFASWLYERVDRRVVDRAVEAVARGARSAGAALSDIANGDLQGYAALMGAGLVLLLALALRAG